MVAGQTCLLGQGALLDMLGMPTVLVILDLVKCRCQCNQCMREPGQGEGRC